MAKKVKVLCEPGFQFSIADESVRADQLTVEQAELVAAQYPGQYVEVIDNNAKSVDSAAK